MKKTESYKHRKAIEVLKSWLSKWFRVREEEEFYLDGAIQFVPDLTCYLDGELVAFYEVEHTHGMTGRKLSRMQEWLYRNQSQAGVYEVEAEYILRQCEQPENLKLINYSIEI